ncbi:MAG: VCBS repeat-containing protein, partial [Calditrichaeota bacterium]
ALGTFYVENQIRYPLGVADLNADHIPDLVCTSMQGNIFAINGATKKQFWYKSLVQDQVIDAQTAFPFALGDFDGDGRADVVAATPTGEIKAFSGMGSNKNSKLLWYYSPSNPAAPLGELLVSDLNKDGIADIVYLDRNNVLRILNGRNGKPIWNTGQPLAEETSMPLLADFGKNGSLDILLISKKNKIYQYQSNSRIPRSKVLWGQAFATPSHVMVSGFTLPGVFAPLGRLILGVVLVLGAVVLLVWNSRKYSQKSY